MSQSGRVTLKDGQPMEVVRLTYPIGPADRMGIIELLQQEWARTDVDWLQSMRGAYSRTLRTQVALARVDGHAVGTASIAFPCERPQVGVVEDVMTRKDFRGLGIAATLTEGLVQRAWKAGVPGCLSGQHATSAFGLREDRFPAPVRGRHAAGGAR